MGLQLGVPRTKSSSHPRVGSSSRTSLTSLERQIVLGTMLGDSSLSYPDKLYSRFPRLAHNHGPDQFEYGNWLNAQLPSLNMKGKVAKNLGYGSSILRSASSCHPDLELIHKLCTVDGKKRVNREWLDRIGPVGLAVWFMDDGSRMGGSAARLHTEGFSFEENQCIADWFASLGLTPRVLTYRGYFYIAFRNEDTRSLLNVVRPHIIPSLAYKATLTHRDAALPGTPMLPVPELSGFPDWVHAASEEEWEARVKARTGTPAHLAYLTRRKALKALRREKLSL